MRTPLVIGNWKLNGNKHTVITFINRLCNKLISVIGCDVAIAPPIIYLYIAKHNMTTNSNIMLCAQNVDTNIYGAFTGEISAKMLKDIGVKYIIIGHYERRYYHKESNEDIAKKFALIKNEGLIPVLCIGESQTDKNASKTEAVCATQLDAILNSIGAKAFENSVIAYEPIWAISTGESANPLYVQKIHNFIRNYISVHDESVAKQVIIQYGGSVNANNAAELFNQPDIDGALVGGASLNAEIFYQIIHTAACVRNKKK
ncbi:triose-phosphate isomerase [Candidatus Palibaumannia cicadellinicola]|uniref:Triosephosphate isomerase n=1 Tax=Candidatus Palibaumannia cicadellinicola TaxID=186490 RepID=A0A0K2BKB1_9GAMM|nr:triose-phosphate isomerase [Candidatus Baumannia cicadellinicola]AKZ65760.1 Triosephosphate isomerase [Candidatus Baumannia cicadellinicola]